VVATAERKKIRSKIAVNVLAHMKSPRTNAQSKLKTDVTAKAIVVFFKLDMDAIFSWRTLLRGRLAMLMRS